MQTTETPARSVADILQGLRDRVEALRAEAAAPVLRGENFVLRAPGGWLVQVMDDGRTARQTPDALKATRWTEAAARRIAADELAAWQVTPANYVETLRRNAADTLELLASYEDRAAELGRS